MRIIRKNEFETSMAVMGASGVILDLGDLHVSHGHQAEASRRVLEVTRQRDFGVLFSFHPYEVTPVFDHPDHNTAGIAAKMAGAAADVRYFYPRYTSVAHRPELYFWTSRQDLATHTLDFSAGSRHHRNAHLKEYYPSQFSAESQAEWGVIFDRITYDETRGKHAERYVRIR